ncbi:MAG TPA: tyrosine-type recombinase/integrase [Micromonosporaceae bacterium]
MVDLPARLIPTGASDHGDLAAVAEAVAALPALPAASNSDRYGPRPVTTAWLLGRPANTRRAYFADLSLWLGYCADVGLDPLTARRADADAWSSQLTGSRRTVARRLSGVSSWYRYLVANDVCQRNPFDAVARPAVHRDVSPTVGMTAAQAAAVLDAADDAARRCGSEAALRDAVLLRILFDTGVRIGALLGANVNSMGHDAGHRVMRYVNKGGHAKRAVLPPHCAALLDRYLEVRARREGGTAAELTGPLLVTTPYRGRGGGKRLTGRDARKLLHRMAQAADVPGAERLSPHSARRTFVTLALASAPLERVQAAVGHQDPRTTLLYQDDRDSLDSSPAYTVAGELARRQRRGDP